MSTKDYGCFYCEGKSSDLDGLCDKCGKKIDIGKELQENVINGYSPQKVLGRGFYGWTLVAKSQINRRFAIKITPKHRFTDDIAKLTREAEAFIKCTETSHRHIADFFQLFEEQVEIGEDIISVIVLVFDYIPNSQPLHQLLKSSEPFNRSDVLDLLSGIASALSRMHSCDLWHDDLHDDNILVRDVKADENLNEKYEIKLIDFGSAKPKRANEPEVSKGNDYDYFSRHIYRIVAHFEKSQFDANQLSPTDRVFAHRLRVLASRISEHDVSRRDIKPDIIINDLRMISTESILEKQFATFDEMLKAQKVSLTDPLENSNALQLHEQDISQLFIDELGWERLLLKSETVVLTGPRGCGKTMLLRYLATINQAMPREGESQKEHVIKRLDENQSISFFVSCTDVKTPFVPSAFEKLANSDASKAGDFSREYINLYYVIEVARTILWLHKEGLAPVSEEHMESLSLVLASLLKGSSLTAGDRNLQIILEDLQRRSINLSNVFDFEKYCPTNLCRDDVLIKLTDAISSLPYFTSKQICFLLDDYSLGILPLSVQKAYNSVVFKTYIAKNSMRIKISSEGDGPILIDQLGRVCKEGREFHKVNLGETYFSVGDAAAQKFIESILKARCEKTSKGSLAKLKQILGEHSSEHSFGSYIRKQEKPGNAKFYGFGLLCKLCSGDVSYVIELFRHIVGADWYDREKPITADEQNKKTQMFARDQLSSLKRSEVLGNKLFLFANNVGNLIKERLVKSKDPDNPSQCIRIEISGSGQLSSEAKEIHDELMRHSILIRGGLGKDKKGEITQKFYFRRLFAPCFPFSPLLGECIDWPIEKYERLLINPELIENFSMSWDKGLGQFKQDGKL